jgi:regulator of replication initiation timing
MTIGASSTALGASNDELTAQVKQLMEELQALREEVKQLKQRDQQQELIPAEAADSETIAAEPKPFVRPPEDNTEFRVYGYARLDAIYDDKQTGFDEAFVTGLIATQGADGAYRTGVGRGPGLEPSEETTFHIQQTRLGVESVTPTKYGNFKVRVEGDFFNSGDGFRIRHAYGEIGQLLVGQTWSNFGDLYSVPNTVDFEGPNSQMPGRNPMIRWAQPITEQWTWNIALEDADYNSPLVDDSASTDEIRRLSEQLPDLVTNLQYMADGKTFQLATVFTRLEGSAIVEGEERNYNLDGIGINASGSWKFTENDLLQYQYTWTEGASHYIADLLNSGARANGIIDSNGQLQEIDVYAGMLALQHWWNSDLSSTVSFGQVVVDNHPDQLDTAYHRTDYYSGNLMWQVHPRITTGVELLYGQRIDLDGASGHATRLQWMGQFNF